MNPFALPSDEISLLDSIERYRTTKHLPTGHHRHPPPPAHHHPPGLSQETEVFREKAKSRMMPGKSFVNTTREASRLKLAAHVKQAQKQKLLAELAAQETHTAELTAAVDKDWRTFEDLIQKQNATLRTAFADCDALAQKKAELRDLLQTLRSDCDAVAEEVSLLKTSSEAMQVFTDFAGPRTAAEIVHTLRTLETNSVDLLGQVQDVKARLEDNDKGENRLVQEEKISPSSCKVERCAEQAKSGCVRNSKALQDLAKSLASLDAKILALGDFSTSDPTKRMFNAEQFLNAFSTTVAALDNPAVVNEVEKRIDQERRDHMRAEYLANEAKKLRERSDAARKRALAPVVKKVVRIEMKRIYVPKNTKKTRIQQDVHRVDDSVYLLN